jgi:surface protein
MNGMFYNATSFNQPIGGWVVSSVTDMSGMFNNATSFNQDIGTWDVSSVYSMGSMFANATSFNQDISAWNVSSVNNFDSFMSGKTNLDYSSTNYDNILNSWSILTLQPNITLDMGTIEYTSVGSTARQSIIDNYAWTINDGGLSIITIPLDTTVYYTSYFTSSISPSPINIGDSITNYYKYNDASATASATGVTNFFGGYTQGYATFSQFNGSNISYISGTYTAGADIALVSYEDPTSDISFIHGSGSSYSIYFVGRPEVFLDALFYERSTIFSTEDFNNSAKWEKMYVYSPGASQGNTFSVVFETQQNSGIFQQVINRIEFEVGLTAAAFDSQPLRIFSVLGQNVGDTNNTAVWSYVDGILVATQSHINVPNSNDPSDGKLELFAESQGFEKGAQYKGYFGELLIYNYKHDSTTHTSVINQLKSRWNI